jgi:predicted HicB family RNase H-like nuclease
MAATSRKSFPSRYTNQFRLRMQPALMEALNKAAAKRLTTPSEYVRQSLIEHLRIEGIDPASTAGAV